MAEYKQTVIPEASTEGWATLAANEVRKKVFSEYSTRYFGKKITNLSLGISVEFEYDGARKTSNGGALYSKKACLIGVLDKLIKYAEYTHWGDRKEKDPKWVVGFLNFKVKVKIDGKLEQVSLFIRVSNKGKFHYSIEVDK